MIMMVMYSIYDENHQLVNNENHGNLLVHSRAAKASMAALKKKEGAVSLSNIELTNTLTP